MAAAAPLSLLIPGLLARLPGADALAGTEWPSLEGLQALLRYGEAVAAPAVGLEAALAVRFGVSPVERLPVASLTRVLDGGAPDEDVWLRADPVYLQADRDSLRLLDDAPALTPEESVQLAAHLNTHFADEGWQIQPLHPQRWYVRWDGLPRLHTLPPQSLLGQRIDHHLPAERAWHRRLNEIQMVLHAAPVNAERESAGRLPVNSLWFWGEGPLPAVRTELRRVWSTEPLARALARRAGIPEQDCDPVWPGEVVPRVAAGDLLVLDTLRADVVQGDLFGWLARLESLDRQWLAPLWERVQAGELAGFELDVGDGRLWRVRKPNTWHRLVRRPRHLRAYLQAPA
ncbi:hypothetical protein HUS23_00470 [Ectothiorhodospiraceae bacterium 2226]|nr:hypothetical protein HUS23_00470 [Ectothiorhodospiraceae bacterium 2226]